LKPEWWGSLLVQEEKYQEIPVKREEEEIIITFYAIQRYVSNDQAYDKISGIKNW
jgi:hypothetical protein